MLDPKPELPDDALIEQLKLPTRISRALHFAGLKTVGEIRESTDATLLSLPDIGNGSVAFLRETLGLPSSDGVRPVGTKTKGIKQLGRKAREASAASVDRADGCVSV